MRPVQRSRTFVRNRLIELWFSRPMTAELPRPLRAVREALRWRHAPVTFEVCPRCGALTAPSETFRHARWHRHPDADDRFRTT